MLFNITAGHSLILRFGEAWTVFCNVTLTLCKSREVDALDTVVV